MRPNPQHLHALHLPATLYHAQDRWPFLLQGAPTTGALEVASPSLSPLVLHHLRLPFMASKHIGFIALDFV